MLYPESVLATPLPAFEGGFGFTPWEIPAQLPPPVQSPSPTHAEFQFSAQAQAQSRSTTPHSSGSDEPVRNPSVPSEEERRLRRMISNRESARRSRMRKQRHLEDLRGQADRLRSENRELANRLAAVNSHCLLFCRDNDRLRSEAAALRRRLSDIRRVLIFRQLHRLASSAPPPPPPPPLPPCGGGLLAACEPQTLVAPPVYGGGFMTETELIA